MELTGVEALGLVSYEKKGILSLIQTFHFDGL